jgi:FkbM family methyltransferase
MHPRRIYEEWEAAHLRRLLDRYQVDCVFDVGANVGQYGRMLRDKVGYDGLLISFEPHPQAVAALRKTARRYDNWLVEDVAIGATDGVAEFHVMRDSQFSSLSTPRHDEGALLKWKNTVKAEVEVVTENLATTLKRLHAAHGFARPFLKLDTQGFDVQIVTSAPDAVRRFVGLQSELAVRKLYADSVDFREAITAYEDCGFQLSALVPNNEGHFPWLVETDCIMVRNDLMP